ncbi:MAG: hypothetical protein HY675_17340 [Chloroflexi bacterium]|nr:hypothetical protein [Chloroflexota bacterium]
MWFRQIDALVPHHRLLIYDNRDVGRSDRRECSYTIRDMADDLAGRIPRAELHLLPDCGHLFSIEQAAGFKRAILDCLRRVDALPDGG